MVLWIWMVAWASTKTEESESPKNGTMVPSNVDAAKQCPWTWERELLQDPIEKDLGCLVNLEEWEQFHKIFRFSIMAEHGDPRAPLTLRESVRAMSTLLSERTKDPGKVLECNVGIIAAYDFLNRALPLLNMDFYRTRYRLVQLALIWIFTLRNANSIPPRLGRRWLTDHKRIIHTIMNLRHVYDREQKEVQRMQESRSRRQIHLTFRDRDLRIAIVSICAYPEDHPISLKTVTPANRERYTRRHGYALRMHLEPPVIGGDIQIQHSKLATVNHYVKSGEFDWVVWLDCDSIIMNMEHTIDSIIYTAIGEWDADISGMWEDSWAPDHKIKIDLNTTSDILAHGFQVGTVRGRFISHWVVEFDFGEGSLRGTLGRMSDIIRWDNGAVWERVKDSLEACYDVSSCKSLLGLKPDHDLLITEEGWGLSSANWIIRSSPWAAHFLDEALKVAHTKQKLFGDQDAMIFLLMNQQVLTEIYDMSFEEDVHKLDAMVDPMDSHCTIIPERQLNAYDQLNAYSMRIEGFHEGDFLITFPQCKDATTCNPLFEIADRYSWDLEKLIEERDTYGASWPYLRVYGPMETVRKIYYGQEE